MYFEEAVARFEQVVALAAKQLVQVYEGERYIWMPRTPINLYPDASPHSLSGFDAGPERNFGASW